VPYILFLLICAIWGASFLLMKKAALAFGPVSIGAWRVLGGAAVLTLLWGMQGRRWPLRREHFWPMALIVLLGYAWPYSVQPYLVARHGSGFIGMTVSLVPLLTIIVSVPILGVYPRPRQLLGVLGGLLFIGLIFADGVRRSVPPLDLLMAASVPLSYAVTNAFIRRNLSDVPALALSASSLALTGALLLPLGLTLPSEELHARGDWGLALGSLVVLGVVSTGLGNYMFNKLVLEHGPLFAGMVTYLIPLGALLWGWFDDERVTWLQMGALLGIFAMVALVQVGSAQRSARAHENLD
jgi:drug/metabolite transporter (DMT)-like permease